MLGACGPGGPSLRFATSTPREDYEAQLRRIGLHTTALGRDWMAAANRAVASPLAVTIPHSEARYLDPAMLTTLIVGDHTAIADSLPALALGDPSVLPLEL